MRILRTERDRLASPPAQVLPGVLCRALDPCGHSLSISAHRSNEAHERSQGMLNRIGYALAVAALASGLMGCQNKLAKERDELYVQNRELQAKNEAMQAAMES